MNEKFCPVSFSRYCNLFLLSGTKLSLTVQKTVVLCKFTHHITQYLRYCAGLMITVTIVRMIAGNLSQSVWVELFLVNASFSSKKPRWLVWFCQKTLNFSSTTCMVGTLCFDTASSRNFEHFVYRLSMGIRQLGSVCLWEITSGGSSSYLSSTYVLIDYQFLWHTYTRHGS